MHIRIGQDVALSEKAGAQVAPQAFVISVPSNNKSRKLYSL